jgi:hypothetical protein
MPVRITWIAEVANTGLGVLLAAWREHKAGARLDEFHDNAKRRIERWFQLHSGICSSSLSSAPWEAD